MGSAEDQADEAELMLIRHLAARPESELDLGEAALVLAEPEYPGLDIGRYLEMLDRLGEQARGGPPGIRSLCQLVYGELGFHGNLESYYDPRNSFLNEV